MGFIPVGFVAGTSVAGTTEFVAGTIEPPELDPSPLDLSMAVVETMPDNLYFQVSARVIKVIPNRLINVVGEPLNKRLKLLFVLCCNASKQCCITGCFLGMCKYIL